MGKIASRCMKDCKGGKHELGEENLENMTVNTPLKAEFETNYEVRRAKAGKNDKGDTIIIDGKKSKKLNKFK